MTRRAYPLLILALLLLTACADSGGGVVAPEVLAAQGKALQLQADAALAATQRAQLEDARRSTQIAAATQERSAAEIALLDKQMQATQAAFDIQMAAASATAQAQAAIDATQAAHATATAQVAADKLAAEQEATATARSQREAERAETFGLIRSILWLVVFAAVAIVLIWQLFVFIPKLLDWLMEWRDRRLALYETRQGTVAWTYDPQLGIYVPRLLGDIYHERPRLVEGRASDVRAVTMSASVLESPLNRHTEASVDAQGEKALALLRIVAAKFGANYASIPRWNKLGVVSNVWQAGVKPLAEAGVVEPRPTGTYVIGEYRNVGEVIYALEMGQLQLSPLPHRADVSAGD